MTNSIIILAIIVLPGWLSISAAQLHHPRLIDRTGVMLWGMLFYHAAVVHAIGIVLFALPVYFLDTLRIQSVLTGGAYAFAGESPGAALVLFGGYFIGMLIVSVVSGILNLPAKLTYGVGWLLRKANLVKDPFHDEPIWYGALYQEREEEEERKKKEFHVFVSIRMKNGDIYDGVLDSYPVDLPDSEEAKDIKLGNSVLYPNGDESSPVVLNFTDFDGGGVLLNTVNISSIQYIFQDSADSETTSH